MDICRKNRRFQVRFEDTRCFPTRALETALVAIPSGASLV
jgi:hypothetical protein